MVMKRYVVGIDIGTTAVKVLVLDDAHHITFEMSKSHPFFAERHGWAEEDANTWWNHTCELLQATMDHLRTVSSGPFEIAGVGLSGMVPAIVLLDAEGRPVRRTIQQNDARCVEQIEQVRQRLNQDVLFQKTGGYTNQQHILPRLLWIRQHEPQVWARVRRVCGSYDWIAHCLTGEWSLELNWAAESGMFDIHHRQWIEDQFRMFDIPCPWLPPVREPTEVVGLVTVEASLQTGLPPGTPVIAGSADHVASALAAGVLDSGDMLIKFGGAGDILFCTDRLQTHERLFFDYHDIPGKYLLNGCMASSGSLVRWFVNQFVPGGTEEDIFRRLDDEAEKIPAGSDGLVVLPYLLGEKTPIFDPDARGVLFGLSLHHTPVHVFRAILESVIYGFRHHIDVLAEKGLSPTRVYATNGGAKSRLWVQIAADILGRPVTSFKGHPGSSLGAAFLAGMAVGMYKRWDEILKCIPERQTLQPNPTAHNRYSVSYGVYRRLYEKLRDEFRLMATTYARG